jgi:hypothetical protein
VRGSGVPAAERARRGAGAPADKTWSGRRGSNPRPTAWKAVTLPLSYSRAGLHTRGASPPRTPLRAHSRGPFSPLRSRGSLAARSFANPLSTRRHTQPLPLVSPRSNLFHGLPTEAPRLHVIEERRLVAREGFEPSKPLGRQIYSLLRLTASLPRRISPPLTFQPVSPKLLLGAKAGAHYR